MDFEKLYEKAKLRREFVKVKFLSEPIEIKELTFDEDLDYCKYVKDKDILVQLFCICPALRENIGKVTPEEIEEILVAFNKVNKKYEPSSEIKNKENTVELNILEQIYLMGKFYSKDPKKIMKNYSSRLIFEWNDTAVNCELKLHGEKKDSECGVSSVVQEAIRRKEERMKKAENNQPWNML